MSPLAFQIDSMQEEDWPKVRAIYQQGIDTGNATFASSAQESWSSWVSGHLACGNLVARDQREVLGWTALTAVSSRCVYAGVAEVSIYVAEVARGRAVGRQLLQELIHRSEQNNIWTLQAGIFPENTPSLALHRSLGFRELGRRERVGKMTFGPFAGKWRDVILLERRSEVAGVG